MSSISSSSAPVPERDPATYAPDFSEQPFWLDDVPPVTREPANLPPDIDVLIVGGGYTGCSAAAEIASGGRSTLILEAGPFGAGCSARNGGQVGTGFKPPAAVLTKRYGEAVADAIQREGIEALRSLGEWITGNGIDCDWRPAGRFTAAHSPKVLEMLARRAEFQARRFDIPFRVVDRRDQHLELNTLRYHGGIVHPLHASVHPAKLLMALRNRATATGAGVIDCCEVVGIERNTDGTFAVKSSRGVVRAREVLVATNGYTGRFAPWIRRRIIPIRSNMIATEPIAPELMRRLMPMSRTVVDSRKLLAYFRPSPDGRRIVFGARAAVFEVPSKVSVPRLLGWLRRIFPELAAVRATHSWSGLVAFTFDELPHLGRHEGVHYCMGYCGSGVSLSVYYGRKIGWQILGRAEGRTALDDITFGTRPFYRGRPWFLAPSILALRALDALSR